MITLFNCCSDSASINTSLFVHSDTEHLKHSHACEFGSLINVKSNILFILHLCSVPPAYTDSVAHNLLQ